MDSYEMFLDSGPLISGSVSISLCIAQSFFSFPFAILLPLLSCPISLSCCLTCGSIPDVPSSQKIPRLFKRVEFITPFSLTHRTECFWLQVPWKRLLRVLDELKTSPPGEALCHFVLSLCGLWSHSLPRLKIYFSSYLCCLVRFVCLPMAAD